MATSVASFNGKAIFHSCESETSGRWGSFSQKKDVCLLSWSAWLGLGVQASQEPKRGRWVNQGCQVPQQRKCWGVGSECAQTEAWPCPNLIVPGSIKDEEAAGVIDSVPVPHPFRYFAFQTVNAAKWLEINVRERPRKAVHHLQLFPGGASALSSIHLDSSAL